ncbi:MAG: hypothetical protein RL406_804 [Pseudomonadota bacterium]
MAIVLLRKNGTVIEMLDGADRFHEDLREKNKATAVEKRLGRTYDVRSTEKGLHLTEHPYKVQKQSAVLIRIEKLPMNK